MEYGGEAGGKYEHERQISFALNFILHTENPRLRRSKVQEKLQKKKSNFEKKPALEKFTKNLSLESSDLQPV